MMPLFFFMKENQLSVFICVNLWQKNRVIRGSRGEKILFPCHSKPYTQTYIRMTGK